MVLVKKDRLFVLCFLRSVEVFILWDKILKALRK